MIGGALTVTPQAQLPPGLRHTISLLKDTVKIFPDFSFSSSQHAACMDGPDGKRPHGSCHHAAGLFGFGHETISNGLSSGTLQKGSDEP